MRGSGWWSTTWKVLRNGKVKDVTGSCKTYIFLRNPVSRRHLSYNWQWLSITEISNRNLMQSWVKAIDLSNSTWCWLVNQELFFVNLENKCFWMTFLFFREIEVVDKDNFDVIWLALAFIADPIGIFFLLWEKKNWQKSKSYQEKSSHFQTPKVLGKIQLP